MILSNFKNASFVLKIHFKSKHMRLIYRFFLAFTLFFLSFWAIAQESCPNFKQSKKSSSRSYSGIRGQAKCTFEGLALVSPRPYDFIPMMNLGGETAFLRHFSFGYNLGFTVKSENRNAEVARFDGMTFRPELRYYFSKAFSGYWIGGQTTVFFQNTGFKDGITGFQFGKSTQNQRHLVTNYYLTWAHLNQFQMVGVGMSLGFLFNN